MAPNAIPQGFVDGKQVTDKILTALQMDPNEYRLGITKVFFKAGVLGMLEDMRDERLAKIISMFQAHIRGYLMRRQYKKLQDQRFVNTLMRIKRFVIAKIYHKNAYVVMSTVTDEFWKDWNIKQNLFDK